MYSLPASQFFANDSKTLMERTQTSINEYQIKVTLLTLRFFAYKNLFAVLASKKLNRSFVPFLENYDYRQYHSCQLI